MSVNDPFAAPTTPTPVVAYSSGTEDDVPDKDTLYQFEGKNVKATAAKITSVGMLEINDGTFRTDEYVTMEIECRVLGVHHATNEKTGVMTRVHTFKAVDATIRPWTASTP